MRELHQLSEHVWLEPRDPHRGVALTRPRPAPAAALQLAAENILWNRRKYFILTWKPSAEASRTVATFVLAFILSPIPFLDIADSDLPKKLYCDCEARVMVLWIENTHTYYADILHTTGYFTLDTDNIYLEFQLFV